MLRWLATESTSALGELPREISENNCRVPHSSLLLAWVGRSFTAANLVLGSALLKLQVVCQFELCFGT